MLKKKTLCLVMIVRNESKVIRRCLDRVKDHIDYWVIVDTGSTDNTPEIIQEVLKSVPGELHREKWINFGVNRTQSLQYAKNKADYLLLCDADEQILFSEQFNTALLEKDKYLISYIGANDYSVPYLIKGDLDWKYVGVTHEYLDCDGTVTQEKITSVNILDLKDGGFKQEKYQRDIALLEEGLQQEPNNSRYKFYLANSYRDIENYEKAAYWYQKRIDDGGWKEEVTCAYENLGNCYEKLARGEAALSTWLKGYDYNPTRLECLYQAIRFLRLQDNVRLGYQLGLAALKIPYPVNDILFIKKSVYEFWIYYEMSICSYYTDDYQLGYDCCKKVLFNQPNSTILKVTLNNLRFYKRKAANDSPENIKKLIDILTEYLKNNQDENAKNTLSFLITLLKNY
ncbi:glycosyltransferase [Caviibacterium pharyngocola]|uniref:Glycosyl transferase n=1 Tax=Caviibacterium pharyngocola TaxID=28159 RepID=A0A2M8RTJ1_9PAST|nr:glycosyltransferase [Caviibacterium pharyngocola]PJG82208.1 glycosyl transferase [Caviibacterium pharyngocola]